MSLVTGYQKQTNKNHKYILLPPEALQKKRSPNLPFFPSKIINIPNVLTFPHLFIFLEMLLYVEYYIYTLTISWRQFY